MKTQAKQVQGSGWQRFRDVRGAAQRQTFTHTLTNEQVKVSVRFDYEADTSVVRLNRKVVGRFSHTKEALTFGEDYAVRWLQIQAGFAKRRETLLEAGFTTETADLMIAMQKLGVSPTTMAGELS